MRRLHTRGMSSANKHVLLSAMCYNLKKLLKFTRQNRQIQIKEKAILAELLIDVQKEQMQNRLMITTASINPTIRQNIKYSLL